MRFIIAISLLILSRTLFAVDLVFTESVIQSTSSTIVPFNYYESLILLKARVKGEEGNFILDTGASGLVLNSKYFPPERMAEATAYGISGNTSQVGRSDVKDMALDLLVFSNLSADHIDLEEIEERKRTKILGLIGYDVIKDLEVMLNYRERFITFTKLSPSGEVENLSPHIQEKIDSFSFELANFIPVIEVSIGEKVKKMGIDTGAEFNVLDNRRNRDVLQNFKVVNRINMSGADGRKRQAIAGMVFKVRLGEKYRCGSMATVLTNMNQLNTIYQMQLDGILGHSFLAPWIFSINYKKKMIYMHKINFSKV